MKTPSCFTVMLFALSVGAAGAVVTMGTTVQSNDQLPVLELPPGQVITYQNIQYKAFTLDEYKTIGIIYTDYRFMLVQTTSLQKELTLRLDMEKNYELQVQGLKDLIQTLELDRDFWTARLKEEQLANKRRAVFSGIEKFGAWALVIVESVALGVIGVYAATQKP